MKQIKFIAMAVAALAMFSCAKEKTPINDEAQGEPVTVQFNISMPAAGVGRVDKTDTGTTEEGTVATADGKQDIVVYVIANGKVEAVVEPADKSTAGNKTATVKITTGKKQILAVVNGKTLSATKFAAGSEASKIDEALLAAVSNASSATNVLFVSKMQPESIKSPTTTDGIQTKPWPISINVERAVAKVVVRGNADFNLGLAASVGKDLQKFALNGKASNSYLYQHVDASVLPVNSATTAWDWKSTGATVTTGDWKAMTTKTALLKDIKGDGSNGGVYTLESVAGSTSLNKNSTQLMVKADILPTAKYTTATNGVGAAIADDDNYTVVKHKTIAKSYRFFLPGVFATWKADVANATEVAKYEDTGVEYTKGINYYLVKIVHDATIPSLKFSVLRNYIYDITLGNINGFGSNDTGTIVDPDEQIEVDAYIEATIKILAWNVKEQTSDLE